MAQTVEVLLANDDRQHKYTRADFTALRAWLNRLPISQISSLYYCEDDLEDMGCATSLDFRSAWNPCVTTF